MEKAFLLASLIVTLVPTVAIAAGNAPSWQTEQKTRAAAAKSPSAAGTKSDAERYAALLQGMGIEETLPEGIGALSAFGELSQQPQPSGFPAAIGAPLVQQQQVISPIVGRSQTQRPIGFSAATGAALAQQLRPLGHPAAALESQAKQLGQSALPAVPLDALFRLLKPLNLPVGLQHIIADYAVPPKYQGWFKLAGSPDGKTPLDKAVQFFYLIPGGKKIVIGYEGGTIAKGGTIATCDVPTQAVLAVHAMRALLNRKPFINTSCAIERDGHVMIRNFDDQVGASDRSDAGLLQLVGTQLVYVSDEGIFRQDLVTRELSTIRSTPSRTRYDEVLQQCKTEGLAVGDASTILDHTTANPRLFWLRLLVRNKLITATDIRINMLDLGTRREATLFNIPNHEVVRAMQPLSNNRLAVGLADPFTASRYKSLRIFDLGTGTEIMAAETPRPLLDSLVNYHGVSCLHSLGNKLAAGHTCGDISVWDLTTYQGVKIFESEDAAACVTRLQLLPGDRLAAVLQIDNQIQHLKIFNLTTNTQTTIGAFGDRFITALQLLDDGRLLVGDSAGIVTVYEDSALKPSQTS